MTQDDDCQENISEVLVNVQPSKSEDGFMIHGYAAQKDGLIDIKTVSETPIAAMVNWLCVDGVLVLRGTTDEKVREIWEDNRRGFEIVPVIVQAAN